MKRKMKWLTAVMLLCAFLFLCGYDNLDGLDMRASGGAGLSTVEQEEETPRQTETAASELSQDSETAAADDRTVLERAFSPSNTIVRLLASMLVAAVVLVLVAPDEGSGKETEGDTYQKEDGGKIRSLQSVKTEISVRVNEKGKDGRGVQDLGTVAASQEAELMDWETQDARERNEEIDERRRARLRRERQEREERRQEREERWREEREERRRREHEQERRREHEERRRTEREERRKEERSGRGTGKRP